MIPGELLSSSGKVYILIICAYRPAQLNLSVISPSWTLYSRSWLSAAKVESVKLIM